MNPKVAIILVKYNQPELEAETIRHVLDTVQYANYTLVAHQNDRGVGLATCWNRLIAMQDAEIVVLLDTDTVPTLGAIDALIEAVIGGAAAAVPSSNRVHMSQVATDHAWAPDVSPKMETIVRFARQLAQDNAGKHELLATASSMCAAFPTSTWEAVGGFDEQFTIWGADTDFFYRVYKKVAPIVWVQDAYVHHYQHASTDQAACDGEFDTAQERMRAAEQWARKQEEIDAAD